MATQPVTTVPDYAAAKAAIVNLTVSLTKELAGTGITVNTVSPGTILTAGLERAVRQIAEERGWGTDWMELERMFLKSKRVKKSRQSSDHDTNHGNVDKSL